MKLWASIAHVLYLIEELFPGQYMTYVHLFSSLKDYNCKRKRKLPDWPTNLFVIHKHGFTVSLQNYQSYAEPIKSQRNLCNKLKNICTGEETSRLPEWRKSLFNVINGRVGEVAVRKPTCSWQRCNWGGVPLFFLTAFTFPSSEDNRWMQRVFLNLAHKRSWIRDLQRQLRAL